jgi:glycosyltransferase involved in cell wall biosynthesis
MIQASPTTSDSTPAAPRLSVIVIAHNEALNIQDCVRSAAFADEVLVLDSCSTDDTVALAEAAGATVVTTDWPGFGRQKNRAIDAARGDWLFSLDADERISPELAREIRQVLNRAKYSVYTVPRRSLFLTRFMRYAGWWPDRTGRLFRRGSARFTESQVHEHLQASQAAGQLTQPLLHYSHRDLSGVLDKVNRYSSASAHDLAARGKRGSLASAISHGLWAFIRSYVFKCAFLEGGIGFVLAFSTAEVAFYKYLKLAELQGRLPK